MLDTHESWAWGQGKGQMYVPFCLAGDFFPSYFQEKFIIFFFFKKDTLLLEEISAK